VAITRQNGIEVGNEGFHIRVVKRVDSKRKRDRDYLKKEKRRAI
jgi:hypothetical protein